MLAGGEIMLMTQLLAAFDAFNKLVCEHAVSNYMHS